VSAICLLLAGSGCTPTLHGPVEVRNACKAFVAEFAPRQTPEVRRGKDGYELVVSFTPAKNAEAEAIIASLRRGPVELIVHPSMEVIRALRIEDRGYLVLALASESQATHVEDALCFKAHSP